MNLTRTVSHLIFVCFCIVLGASVAGAADKDKPKTTDKDSAKAELAKLEGKWKVVSWTKSGEERKDKGIIGESYKFVAGSGGESDQLVKGDPKQIIFQISLDPAKTPKQIDINHGEAIKDKAIYKLDGNKLTICQHEKDRPSDFTTKKGDGRTLWVLERVKADK